MEALHEEDDVIIFGATDTGKRIYEEIKSEKHVIAFVDEDESKWDTEIDGIEVKDPKELPNMRFAYIYWGFNVLPAGACFIKKDRGSRR